MEAADVFRRQFIDFLHENDTNAALPEIAVMGDTSSGKSSLLSAICLINLPSDKDITTRCPVRICMMESAEVRAEVRIKWEESSSQYGTRDEWAVKLDNWEEVTASISAAQIAILKNGNRQVAEDVIVVNIYGPQCVNLTLTDLPGMVRTVGKGEKKTLAADIAHLTDKYLKNERCVILAVQPANVDFHNSQILADAKKVDPDTKRTIPVITKPDLIDKGAEGSVLQLLLGRKMDDFEMGFHMVRRPGQMELNQKMTLNDSMAAEERFFSTVAPWKDEPRRDLFGVVALRSKLAQLQVRMIQTSIPGIIEEILQKRHSNAAQLDVMGSLVSSDFERRSYYSQVVKSILGDIQAALEGKKMVAKGGAAKFLVVQKQIFDKFVHSVLDKPFADFDRVKQGSDVIVSLPDGREGHGKVLHVRGSGEQTMITVCPRVKSQAEADVIGSDFLTHAPSVKVPANLSSGSFFEKDSVLYVVDSANGAFAIKEYPIANVEVDPEQLKLRMRDNITTDLPCFLNAQVFNSLVAEMVSDEWEPLCRELHAELRDVYENMLTTAAGDHLPPSRYPALRQMVLSQVRAVAEAMFTSAAEDFALEMRRESLPTTFNHYLFENITKMRNKRLRAKLLKMVQGKTSGIEAIISAAFDSVERLSLEDHIAYEMQVILAAYGKLAAKRVIDKIPQIIRLKAAELVSQLESALQVSDSTLTELMVEDALTVGRHRAALEEKRKLDLAYGALQKLQFRAVV